VQVPARRAAERDEQQISAWPEEVWPEIKPDFAHEGGTAVTVTA
jgi:hypothetical protein